MNGRTTESLDCFFFKAACIHQFFIKNQSKEMKDLIRDVILYLPMVESWCRGSISKWKELSECNGGSFLEGNVREFFCLRSLKVTWNIDFINTNNIQAKITIHLHNGNCIESPLKDDDRGPLREG